DGSGERGDEELAIWVRPWCAARPVDADQTGPSAAVLAAAEVDEALRAVDERREQIWGNDVDRQHLRAGVDAGVVDHGVHRAEAVQVTGDCARLVEVGEVADDGQRAAGDEVADGGEPVAVASVDDELVAIVEQGLRSQPSETVRGS